MEGPKSLEETMAPINWLNWAFGLGIIEIPRGHPRVILSIIYVGIFLSVYFTLFSWRLIALDDELISYEKVSVICVLTVNVLVAFLSVVLAWYNSKNQKRILMKCSKADEVLHDLGLEKAYGETFRRTIITVCLFIICAILICCIDMFWLFSAYGIMRAITINILIHVPSIVNSVVDITFASHVWCLGNKIEKMNKLIAKICLCTHTGVFVGHCSVQSATCRKMLAATGCDTKKAMIRRIVQISRISQQINKTYCLQVLLELAVQFTVITAALFNIYLAIMKPAMSRLPTQDRILRMCLWACFNITKIIFLNGSCDKVSREAKKTGQILQELDGKYRDDDIMEEIQQFSMQTILRPLTFSAFGFFTLNNEFTRMFFGTVTTYLVILIQMTPTDDNL